MIEQTYRNSQPLIDITSKFIQKNSRQISKRPKSMKEPADAPIKFVQYNEGEIEDPFINEIGRLVSKYGNKSILVLGRHSFNIHDLIALTPKSRVKYIERTGKLEVKGFEEIDINFLSYFSRHGAIRFRAPTKHHTPSCDVPSDGCVAFRIWRSRGARSKGTNPPFPC